MSCHCDFTAYAAIKNALRGLTQNHENIIAVAVGDIQKNITYNLIWTGLKDRKRLKVTVLLAYSKRVALWRFEYEWISYMINFERLRGFNMTCRNLSVLIKEAMLRLPLSVAIILFYLIYLLKPK